MTTPRTLVLLTAISATLFTPGGQSKQESATAQRDHVIEYIERHAASLNTVTLDGYLKLKSVKKTSLAGAIVDQKGKRHSSTACY